MSEGRASRRGGRAHLLDDARHLLERALLLEPRALRLRRHRLHRGPRHWPHARRVGKERHRVGHLLHAAAALAPRLLDRAHLRHELLKALGFARLDHSEDRGVDVVAVHPRRNGLVADRQDALGLQLHVDRLQDGGLQIGVGVLAQLVLGGGRRGVLAHGSFQGRARFGLRLHLGLLCNGREALQAGGELGLVDLVVGGGRGSQLSEHVEAVLQLLGLDGPGRLDAEESEEVAQPRSAHLCEAELLRGLLHIDHCEATFSGCLGCRIRLLRLQQDVDEQLHRVVALGHQARGGLHHRLLEDVPDFSERRPRRLDGGRHERGPVATPSLAAQRSVQQWDAKTAPPPNRSLGAATPLYFGER